ncbi:uncharacterized protein FIBRA_01565 [Fibroporia radiculosa]|uniref:Uncharacterized protein n=1 Tax=Fibroporia radiculosa TaxID=599839 RepID=J4HTJ3_9APHY|nr:uncharacterized protein FIBRA_01565 [Fibroporia radiculosa]CCL99547.1 predicted protein [Fibroporia radiculosa]
MGYQTTTNGTTTTSYGHIAIRYQSNSCLTVGNFSEPHSSYLIRSSECSHEDNASQLEQYWSLTNASLSGSLILDFVGVSADGLTINNSGNLSYAIWYRLIDDLQIVSVASVKEPGVQTRQRLRFSTTFDNAVEWYSL